jgi:hypothetical protein
MRNSLKDYCQTQGYNMVSVVRENTNGYAYVTLIDAHDGSNTENLYLGQRYAGTVTIGDKLPINELFVAETVNTLGETRLKLTDSNGEVSAAKLVDYQSF